MKRSARMAAFLLAAALSAAPCLAEFTPVEVPAYFGITPVSI